MILLPRAAAHLPATQAALEETGLADTVTTFTLSHSAPQPMELPPGPLTLAFTSLNAVEAAVAANLQRYPCLCVGASTTKAAQAAGFPVLHTATTAAELADHLTVRPVPKLVHLHGHPANLSWHKGHNITPLLAYTTTYIEDLPPAIADAFAQGEVTHTLLLSSESAKHLRRLLQKDTMALWPSSNPPPVLALSPHVAQTAQSLGFPVMATSPQPSLPQLLATLKKHLPNAATSR
jgi:uroporphyrinogen-III synthase